MCLSDRYYAEDVDRITREPTQRIPPCNNPGKEHQSDLEVSSVSSSSETAEESSDTERTKDRDDKGNQSGDEDGNGDDPAAMEIAEHLLRGQDLSGIADGTAHEAEQYPSHDTADDQTNAPVNQSSMASAASQVAKKPLPAADPRPPLESNASEHSQQEQPQQEAKSNARE